MSRLGFIENRLGNQIETPGELYADIGQALAVRHMEASLDYEHRYLDIVFRTRQCPACGSVERLQVVLNTDMGVRRRHCPACDAVVEDEHLESEQLQLELEAGRRVG